MKKQPANPAGYSGTPLPKKLGVKAGQRALFVNAPGSFVALLGPLPEGFEILKRPAAGLDYIHLFVTAKADLARRLPPLDAKLADTGMIWVSWPKASSPLAGDIKEDDVRAAALPLGLVDVKVCAIDADWSGLKIVRRVKKRSKQRAID